MKLQDAFVAEAGAIGSFSKIGYSMPASTNFAYTEPTAQVDAAEGTTNIDKLDNTGKAYWQADNNTKLNDCAMHSHWQVSIAQPTAGSEQAKSGAVVYSAGVEGETGATHPCNDLTPNFKNIGK